VEFGGEFWNLNEASSTARQLGQEPTRCRILQSGSGEKKGRSSIMLLTPDGCYNRLGLQSAAVTSLHCLHITQAMFSSKIFQDFPSHRIFGHMHRALNVDEKKLIT
jgi:hypothetical protein